ncbi:MAG: hypothetical protein ABJN26_09675 [Stappiaceae bacterium]
MRTLRTVCALAFMAVATVTIGTPNPVSAQEVAHPHLPPPGSEVVIYTHKFAPQHFDEGIRLVSEGFAEIIKEMGQDRTNFIMTHPSTFEVLNVSFFENKEEVRRWHEFEGRLGVVEKLKPLMVAPIDIQTYSLAEVHDAK